MRSLSITVCLLVLCTIQTSGRKRGPMSGFRFPPPLLPCKLTDGSDVPLEEKSCPEDTECSGGPLSGMIASATRSIYFCKPTDIDIPLPDLMDAIMAKVVLMRACSVVDDAGDVFVTKECCGNDTCSAGSLVLASEKGNVTASFCTDTSAASTTPLLDAMSPAVKKDCDKTDNKSSGKGSGEESFKKKFGRGMLRGRREAPRGPMVCRVNTEDITCPDDRSCSVGPVNVQDGQDNELNVYFCDRPAKVEEVVPEDDEQSDRLNRALLCNACEVRVIGTVLKFRECADGLVCADGESFSLAAGSDVVSAKFCPAAEGLSLIDRFQCDGRRKPKSGKKGKGVAPAGERTEEKKPKAKGPKAGRGGRGGRGGRAI